jgi:hypothetical protein
MHLSMSGGPVSSACRSAADRPLQPQDDVDQRAGDSAEAKAKKNGPPKLSWTVDICSS